MGRKWPERQSSNVIRKQKRNQYLYDKPERRGSRKRKYRNRSLFDTTPPFQGLCLHIVDAMNSDAVTDP